MMKLPVRHRVFSLFIVTSLLYELLSYPAVMPGSYFSDGAVKFARNSRIRIYNFFVIYNVELHWMLQTFWRVARTFYSKFVNEYSIIRDLSPTSGHCKMYTCNLR